MDFVSAKIALAGDPAHIMFRGPNRPVSWPEVRLLQSLHGEENVFDCDFVRSGPSTMQEEKMRLLGLYGKEAVDAVYPGARPMMELEFPGERDAAGQKRPERRLVADIQRSDPAQQELSIEPPPLAKAKRAVPNAEV